jgi:hypothetical protein
MSGGLPKLRSLEAIPVVQDGQQMIALRDPSQIREATLLVPPEFYAVLPYFNGRNTILDLQTILTRRSGQLVFRDQIEKIIEQLDQALFLDNDHYYRKKSQIIEKYRAEPRRTASHAGISYPEDPQQLKDMLDSFFSHESGAGCPGTTRNRLIRAIAAPHIDLRLGGPVYSHAYRALAESRLPETIFILGIGHMGLPGLYSITRKDFETPLGKVSVDNEFLETFFSNLDRSLFADHISHRTEHSIEFQVIFLKYLFGQQTPQIIPVLTSFNYRDLIGPDSSSVMEQIDSFVDALLKTERQTGNRIMILASVDLAHIGPRYGDSSIPNSKTVEGVMQKDQELMNFLIESNPRKFLDYIAQEDDKRRTCGFPALYSLLKFVGGKKGCLLSHGYGEMDSTHSFVTYASLVWYDSPAG